MHKQVAMRVFIIAKLFVVFYLAAKYRILTCLLAASAGVVVLAAIDGELNFAVIRAHGQFFQNYQFKCRK